MQTLSLKLRELIFRLKLYLLGVRFFERNQDIGEPMNYTATYQIQDRFTVKVSFRQVKCIDFIMRRGRIIGKSYISYAIRGDFNGQLPENLKQLNGRCFFFNTFANGFSENEDMSLALIADVYLDFICSVEEYSVVLPSSL